MSGLASLAEGEAELAKGVAEAETLAEKAEPVAVDLYGKVQEVISFLHQHWPGHPSLPAPLPTPVTVVAPAPVEPVPGA